MAGWCVSLASAWGSTVLYSELSTVTALLRRHLVGDSGAVGRPMLYLVHNTGSSEAVNILNARKDHRRWEEASLKAEKIGEDE